KSGAWRFRAVETVRPHLADLVAGRRCRSVDIHSLRAALGSEPILEIDKTPIGGRRRCACVADGRGWDNLWSVLPIERERRSLDVSVHAVSGLDRLSIRPARILSGHLPAFRHRSSWNRARERALRSRIAERFAAPPAVFPGSDGFDDTDFRRGSNGAPPSGGTCSRDGGQRPAHRPCQLPPVDRAPRFGNHALWARRAPFFGNFARSRRLKKNQ